MTTWTDVTFPNNPPLYRGMPMGLLLLLTYPENREGWFAEESSTVTWAPVAVSTAAWTPV